MGKAPFICIERVFMIENYCNDHCIFSDTITHIYCSLCLFKACFFLYKEEKLGIFRCSLHIDQDPWEIEYEMLHVLQ